MRIGLPLGIEGSLGRPLAWLTGVRLVVLTIFLTLTSTVYLENVSFGGFSSMLSGATVGLAFGLTAIYTALARRGRLAGGLAVAQLVSDQLLWTALVYVTGGPTSGATSLYGFTCISGAILLGVRGGITAFVTGVASYVALTAGLIEGIVPVPPDQQNGLYELTWSSVTYPILLNVLAMLVVTTLAGYLAERLRVAGGRLEIATARAEQAEQLAVLGELAAGLAHEIRNPLGAIRGSVELLRTSSALSEEDRMLCELVERETGRLDDLVTDMLDLAKRRAAEPRWFDVGRLAREVARLASGAGRGAEVGVRYAGPESEWAFADPALMRQLVWNLVRNAVQASAPGAGVLVTLTSPDGPTPAQLEVADRGRGIAPAEVDRIFDAFYSTRSGGTGVGLAVVKRIADQHGFPVRVESEQGEGAVFRVILVPPLTAPPRPTEEPPSSGPRSSSPARPDASSPPSSPPKGAPPKGASGPAGAGSGGAS